MKTLSLIGIEPHPVTIEVSKKSGPFSVIGIAVRETKARVIGALTASGFPIQAGIVVDLRPSLHLPKAGSAFDLPIALALLAGAEIIPADVLEQYTALGELDLNGKLCPTRGAVAYGRDATGPMIVPEAMASQMAAASTHEVYGAPTLTAAVNHLRGDEPLEPAVPAERGSGISSPDLVEVSGQGLAKRALEVAAAGGHNLLLTGPPGTGKTLLARFLPGVLPPLSLGESLETSAIWSVAGLFAPGSALLRERPLRAPHYTVSDAGMVGGGAPPRPGEVSLAHNGVLLLDELPEFRRSVLEALRQPLGQGVVVAGRATQQVTFPARVQLVATMNPCPCGNSLTGRCSCSPEQVRQYRSRVPLNWFDIGVESARLKPGLAKTLPRGEGSAVVRARVSDARLRQMSRCDHANARLFPGELRRYCPLSPGARGTLKHKIEVDGLSTRDHDRVLRVARTIADLRGDDQITSADVSEAVYFATGKNNE